MKNVIFVLAIIIAITTSVLSQNNKIGSYSYITTGWVKLQNDARPPNDTNAYSQLLLKGDRAYFTDGFVELIKIDSVKGYLVESIANSYQDALRPLLYELKLEKIKIDGDITAEKLKGTNYGIYAPKHSQFYLTPEHFKNGRLHPKFIAYKKELIEYLVTEKKEHADNLKNIRRQYRSHIRDAQNNYRNNLKDENESHKLNQDNTRWKIEKM